VDPEPLPSPDGLSSAEAAARLRRDGPNVLLLADTVHKWFLERRRARRAAGGTRAALAVLLALVSTTVAAPAAATGAPQSGPGEASTPGFHTVAVQGPGSVAALRARLGAEVFGEVLRLNRVDARHVAELDSLVLPEPAAGFRAPAPFPDRADELERHPKLVLVSIAVQAFAAYDSGRLVRWGPVSTGDPAHPTPRGAFHANWKARVHRSTVDSTWLMRWCVNIENREGIALHHYALPGRPASHCCVRLLEPDARWLFEWVEPWRLADDGTSVLEPGTPVWITGAYDFDAPPPWRRLPADPGADRAGPEALEKPGPGARQ
jgi:lipoprotein-anchoring transpeptidase ErfK/SrfK